MTKLKAVALVCTLKKSPGESSSQLLAEQVLEQLEDHDCTGEVVRVVDQGVAFGVSKDEGISDGWPQLREKVLAADILVLATPIWMGQPSSVCKMTLERLDAELGETDSEGRPSMYGKVAVMAVVGNEDGAHHVTAEVAQALLDVGFSIPAQSSTYWVGEAMGSTDYQDLDKTPEKTAGTNRTVAANAAHLARLLRDTNYPAPT
ncbi:MAG: flavodoxin family protein [Marmoricola sp.]